MSLPDATAISALQGDVIKPVWFAFLDILGDPVRTNTSGADITPTGVGDSDIDGHVFSGVSCDLVSISPVKFALGGSQTVTAVLSGIPGLDDDTIAQLDDKANWRGRNARIWRVIRNASNVQQGGFQNYYTGKMIALRHAGSAGDQIIEVTIEGYISVLSQASNRTYMDQVRYDPGDLSAQGAMATANGNYTGAPAGPGSSLGGAGAAFGDGQWNNLA